MGFVTPPLFFLSHFIISLYIPNPYFIETSMISLSQFFFPSLLITNPYFVLPPSFFCLNSFSFFILAKSILRSNPMIFLLQIIRPPSFFCLNSFISLYNPNPYFVKTPMISLPQISYFFTNTKSILCLSPIIFFLCRQIHTSSDPHHFFSPPSNPYFIRSPSFFFSAVKSILHSNPMIFLPRILLFLY